LYQTSVESEVNVGLAARYDMFLDLNQAYLIATLFFLTSGCYVYILIDTRLNFTASNIRRDYIITSLYLALFALAYGLMTIANNALLVRIFWAIGFYIACVYNSRWILCFSQMLPVKVKHIKAISRGFVISTTIITALCIYSNDAIFILTRFGNQFSYQHSGFFIAALINFSLLITTVVYLHVKWWRIAVIKRQRIHASVFILLALIIGPIGFITDFFIPIFTDITIVPTSAFVFLAVSIPIWVIMRVNQTISVTVPNVSGHVFRSVTLPSLVLDSKNIVGLENEAALDFLGRSVIGENIANIVTTSGKKPEQTYFESDHTHEKVTVNTPLGDKVCDLLFTLEYDKYGDAIYKIVIIRDISESEYSDNLLRALNTSTAFLLNSDIESFEDDLFQAMEVVGAALNIERMSIWKNHMSDGQVNCTKVYEWYEGADKQYKNEHLVSISYGTNAPDWEEAMTNGDSVNAILRYMSEAEQTQFSPKGTLNALIVPVFLHSNFWGFVGFNDSRRDRKFNEIEESISRSCSLVFAHAYQRNEIVQNMRSTSRQLELALGQTKAANRAKSEFLASMSHEIRTPMNSIIGFTELSLDNPVPPKVAEYLGNILKNSEWLLHIINDVLDISKIESGKMGLENVLFDMSDVFDVCRMVIMPKADEKGLKVNFYAEPPIGKRFYGDSTRLKQILLNILSNAVKFTETGTIRVMAIVRDMDANHMKMYFEVKDSGIGMTEEQMERIFDAFTQAETGTTRKYGGTGLGLAITKKILEMMGGELSVESAPGVGSKFSFELTFNTVDADKRMISGDQVVIGEINKPTFEGEILLCEDNTMNQQVAIEHLARVGLKTTVAKNGQIGVDLVQSRKDKGEKQFDLIFMDIHMPIMDGIEATEKIIDMDVKIPIIAMTANIMSNDTELYNVSGMNDYIGKPFTTQELWRCLLRHLEPVSWQKDSSKKHEKRMDDLQKKLTAEFVKSNRDRIALIKKAISDNDISVAHRMVHTLKSNAGQLRKERLQQAAEKVEVNLAKGVNKVTARQLGTLETELNKVLKELTPEAAEDKSHVEADNELDNETICLLLDQLKDVLKANDSSSLSFIDDLKLISGSDALIQQIEEYDFPTALILLDELKKKFQ